MGTHALPGDLCGSRHAQLSFDGLRYSFADVELLRLRYAFSTRDRAARPLRMSQW
jgi:hypothetical protein